MAARRPVRPLFAGLAPSLPALRMGLSTFLPAAPTIPSIPAPCLPGPQTVPAGPGGREPPCPSTALASMPSTAGTHIVPGVLPRPDSPRPASTGRRPRLPLQSGPPGRACALGSFGQASPCCRPGHPGEGLPVPACRPPCGAHAGRAGQAGHAHLFSAQGRACRCPPRPAMRTFLVRKGAPAAAPRARPGGPLHGDLAVRHAFLRDAGLPPRDPSWP